MARTGRMASDEAVALTVGEVMIHKPKALPADALVSDIRREFENPSVRTALLADDGIFRGAVDRDRLPADAPETDAAVDYADTEPVTATPATPIPDAIELLAHQPEPRLIVLDEDGATLRGLLCFNRSSSEFCVR